MSYPHRLSTELRLRKREAYTRWFAYWIVTFTISWFAIHFFLGAVS